MNSRIRELRKSLKLTQQEFADSLVLSRTTVSSFESGAKQPGPKTLEHICLKYDVNKDWLLNGIGEMYLDDIAQTMLYNEILGLLDEDDPDTLEMIKEYISLTHEDKSLIKQMITRFKK